MKGFFGTLEMICIGALMLLFGLMTYTLVAVGGGTFERILDKRETTSDLRVALSYVSMQVRKNDTSDAIDVVSTAEGEYLSLKQDYDGEIWENRVFFRDGMLYDAICAPDEPFEPELGSEILPLENFYCVWDGRILTVTAVSNGVSRELSLTLRSEAA